MLASAWCPGWKAPCGEHGLPLNQVQLTPAWGDPPGGQPEWQHLKNTESEKLEILELTVLFEMDFFCIFDVKESHLKQKQKPKHPRVNWKLGDGRRWFICDKKAALQKYGRFGWALPVMK